MATPFIPAKLISPGKVTPGLHDSEPIVQCPALDNDIGCG